MRKSDYTPLPSTDDEVISSKKGPWGTLAKYLFILLGAILYLYPFVYTIRSLYEDYPPSEYARTSQLNVRWKKIWWNTHYSPHDHTESDYLWDAINPAHGIIAVDRQWAVENHWPVSMQLPDDETKGVYLLEAYHHLHCLKIIRRTFWEAVENRTYTSPPSKHVEHCFDALRQSIQCNADNTPLYTFGNYTAGNGQLHRCHDWNQLHEYATKNTACYKDSVKEIPLVDHFGHCDDARVDGLEGAF